MGDDGGGDNVKVAVRVRPFNGREKERGAQRAIFMKGKTTTILNVAAGGEVGDKENEKTFTFDYSYDSFDSSDENYATQTHVFNDLGEGVLKNAWSGFNTSLFAYGQTGAGKSYSMVGYGPERGIIPISCEVMFQRIAENDNEKLEYNIEVTMLEIYMEVIRDLLNPATHDVKGGLKVRNNKKLGVYVDGLSQHPVTSYKEVEQKMEDGTNARTVASTAMNATSSRAHTVFAIIFQQITTDDAGAKTSKVSKVNLVDLAGSERANSTGATGDRLKEGSAINKSLSSLGNVISALAENSDPAKKKKVFVPYRNSTLTRLLQDALGGNSKTIMIAALSPADINYDETLSTLRYADRAKQIKNAAVINESPTDKLINDLKAEIERLKAMFSGDPAAMAAAGGEGAAPVIGGLPGMNMMNAEPDPEAESLREQLRENEKLVNNLNKSWEDKLLEAEKAAEEKAAALIAAGGGRAVDPRSIPHLVNLHEDIMMSEALVFPLKDTETKCGRKDSPEKQDIELRGVSIMKEHAVIEQRDGKFFLRAMSGAAVFHNGTTVTEEEEIHHTDRVMFGSNYVLRFHHPELHEQWVEERTNAGENAELRDVYSWDVAQKEFAIAQGGGLADQIESMGAETDRQRTEREKEITEHIARLIGLGAAESDPVKKELKLEQDALKALRKSSGDWKQKLESDLASSIPMVNEANEIAKALGKPVFFELKVITKVPESASLSPLEELRQMKEVTLGLNLVNAKTGLAWLWTFDKFRDRLFLMRESYNNFVEFGELDETKEEDPFYDPPTDVLVGKSYVYLEPLAYLMEVEDPCPVIDYKGQEQGLLSVTMFPCNTEGETDGFEGFADEPNDLIGTRLDFILEVKNLRGLPATQRRGSFVRFGFYLDKEPHETEQILSSTNNPDFEFRQQFTVDPVTPEFVSYLKRHAMQFQVYSMPLDPDDKKAGGYERPKTAGMRRRPSRTSMTMGIEKVEEE